jgi:5-methylcytosine-specific restriction endonuclease McrA
VFARDRYSCVYCGRRTVFLQVLNLLSLAFAAELPRHQNWKKAETHRLYWDLTTSIDHVHPVSRGGYVDALENLATVCARCQYQKSNRSIESLGWRRQEIRGIWDGLTGLYESLWTALGKPSGVQRRWIVAVRAANEVTAATPTSA